MKSNKPTCNTEMLADMMEYSKHGAMMQIFVVTAIEKYAQQVLAAAERGEPVGGWMTSDQAWTGCAKEALAKMDAFYSYPVWWESERKPDSERDHCAETEVRVTIVATGDHENSPEEAIHHALSRCRKDGSGIVAWSIEGLG